MQTIFGKSNSFSPELEVAIAEYRHKIFIERLGWPLPVENGMERDQFDRPDTLYVVAREPNGSICGCARLLPTTEPYLLSEIFPHLLAGAPVPNAHDIWELSRFAAASTDPHSTIDASVNTRSLLAAAVKSAAEQGATRLITVSPLGIERLLHRMGVHAHRAGPPSLADGKPIFACWIEIDEQTISALNITVEGWPETPTTRSSDFATKRKLLQANEKDGLSVQGAVTRQTEDLCITASPASTGGGLPTSFAAKLALDWMASRGHSSIPK